jgi:16S rRNA (cytosine1402-N4)-methyltransferase
MKSSKLSFYLINFQFKTLVKIFQALRIAVNDELVNLKELLLNVTQKLSSGGLAMIITFHSLEEALVLEFMNIMKRQKVVKVVVQKLKPG